MLSPISEHLTVVDLAETLQLPVLVVAANRLGAVNHSLLTLSLLETRRLDILALVLNDMPPSSDDGRDAAQATNRDLLLRFTKWPLIQSVMELSFDNRGYPVRPHDRRA